MNTEFGQKLEKLSVIVENRRMDSSNPGSVPTKFSFVNADDGLKCVWTPSLTPKETARVVYTMTISKYGLTSAEWTDLTQQLSQYL